MVYRHHLILAFITLIFPPAFPWHAAEQEPDLARFFHALAAVESNHDDDAVGDGGKSIGRLQIQYAYWYDATEFSGIGGKYQDVKGKDYAELVARCYFQRYESEAYRNRDYETLSRLPQFRPKLVKEEA